MGKFAVVTDSTADLEPAIAERYGVSVVPLSVAFGSEVFTDGVLTQQEFFDWMASSPTLPTTSQPPVGAFVEAFERALHSAESVIAVTISSRLSGTFASASQAAERFAGRVHVFDSLNLSLGLGFQVLDAAASAAEGLDVPAALERLKRARARVRMIIGLDSLDNLRRGGRIGRVSALLGSLLDLKITFTVDANGEFHPLYRSRGEKAALAKTLDWVSEQMGGATRGAFAVGHALAEGRARWLADAIRERFDVSELIIYETGSVIATHTGTGWGVTVLPAE